MHRLICALGMQRRPSSPMVCAPKVLLRWLHAVTSWSTVMQTLSCVEAYATP